jgi:hypothetical protein
MDAGKIIDKIGGTTAVARLCDLTTGAVSQWRSAGIPKAWRKFLRAVRPDVFAEADSGEQAAA